MALRPLPARSAGAAPRSRAERLPAAQNVPQVSIGRDPGVNVPQLGQVGEAIQDTGETLTRIARRSEGLARDADDAAFDQSLSRKLNELRAAEDLSDEQVVDQAEAFSEELFEKTVEEHRGGGTSRTMLANRLRRRATAFTDRLATLNIAASEDRLNLAIDKRGSAIVADVLADPEVVLSDDPRVPLAKHFSIIDDEIEFLELTPLQARATRQALREEVANSMITPLIRNDQFQKAKELLRAPELAEVISPAARREMARRVIDAERDLTKGRREGQALRQKARALLGPSASEADVSRAARDMAGIEERNNLSFIKAGPSILALDKRTGSVVQRIETETPEAEAERQSKIEEAKLQARVNVMQSVFRNLGLRFDLGQQPQTDEQETGQDQPSDTGTGIPRIAPPPADPPAVTAPFDAGEAASEDAQDVARLFAGSRALFQAGFAQEGNAFLAQARFLAENSPEIQRERELDKPISADLAATLGVSVGTPLRDVMARIPPSPEQAARTTSGARARGRQDVRNQQQLDFIEQATDTVTDLLEEIEADPTIVGAAGSFRRAAQTATGVTGDLLRSVLEPALDIADTQSDLSLDEISELFDLDNPNLSTLGAIQNSVGLILARLRTPQGRVPVDVIKRSVDDVKLTGLTSSKQVRTRLRFILKQLDRRARALRRQSGATSPETGVPLGAPRFRVEGGQLVPAGQ